MTWDVEREIVTFGSFALRWYSLLFALGFVIGYAIMQSIFRKEGKPERLLDSLLLHAVIGTIVGARLGHCLFYEPAEYLSDPLRILKVWEGGLASHGGFTGLIVSLGLFCRKHRDVSFLWLADRMAIPSMLTGAFIRIGNFFNSEIVGKPASVPWAITFKKVDLIPRHPAQLYEAAGYVVITLILYAVYRGAHRRPLEGRLVGLVLMLGFGFRLFVEMFKENQEAFESTLPLNMGQLLSLPFIVLGLFLVCGGAQRFRIFRPLTDDAGILASDEDDATVGAGAQSRRGQARRLAKKARK